MYKYRSKNTFIHHQENIDSTNFQMIKIVFLLIAFYFYGITTGFSQTQPSSWLPNGIILRLGEVQPRNVLKGPGFNTSRPHFSDNSARFPVILSFPRSTFWDTFYSNTILDYDEVEFNMTENDVTSYLSSEEKSSICPNTIVGEFEIENDCPLSVNTTYQALQFGYSVGFLGFEENIPDLDVRFLELGVGVAYMVLRLQTVLNICGDQPERGAFELNDTDGTCNGKSTRIDRSQQQFHLLVPHLHLVLATYQFENDLIIRVGEADVFKTESIRIPFANHQSLQAVLYQVSRNLFSIVWSF